MDHVTEIVMKIVEKETRKERTESMFAVRSELPISGDDHIETFFELNVVELSSPDQDFRLNGTRPAIFIALSSENDIEI